ncbi:helix-turn-helix transcriptional regulator [Jatrophihabitans sp.]|uniref:helix-turn-helix transcriptional regulator n=1 Tax=Jatrophihabitans sp. TaxID=1932789 RepID=UPI002BF25D9B|nr:helix-turn-helix domain-containing protein [Jatrophihabitans sp.]
MTGPQESPPPQQASRDGQLRSIASLGEPVRLRLYRYVAAQPGPVSREQAAGGVGVAHHVAKFHLDKLEEDGLLEVEFRRPDGRTGPGAGRPAKFYRRAGHDIAVSLPERHYELPARLMAQAISDSTASDRPVAATLQAAARATGRPWGRRAGSTARRRPGPDQPVAAVCEVLAAEGYEPRAGSGVITLGNCPFASLAREHTELVCGMNLDLMRGLLDGLAEDPDRPSEGAGSSSAEGAGSSADGADSPAEGSFGALQARLEPAAGRCCVTLGRPADG